MKFKTQNCPDELSKSCPLLQKLAADFEALSQSFGIESMVTRVWGTIDGDSGVHAAKRAIDFRNETLPSPGESHFLYSDAQTQTIVNTLNSRYLRKDGKPTCLYHSFQGAPWHFHVQVPITMEDGYVNQGG